MALGTIASVASAGLGAGQMIAGKINEKKAAGMAPELVDPTQRSMLNLTKREFRASKTGTAYTSQYKKGAALAKMLMRKSLFGGGGKSVSSIRDLMQQNTENVMARASNERLGLLASMVKQNQDIADRKMDLQSLAQEKLHLKSQTQKQTGGKNLMGGLGTVLTGAGPSGGSNKGGAGGLSSLLGKIGNR